MSVDNVFNSDLYHLLPADRDCIKFRIEFLESENLFVYFIIFYVMLPPCVLLKLKSKSNFRFRTSICFRKLE